MAYLLAASNVFAARQSVAAAPHQSAAHAPDVAAPVEVRTAELSRTAASIQVARTDLAILGTDIRAKIVALIGAHVADAAVPAVRFAPGFCALLARRAGRDAFTRGLVASLAWRAGFSCDTRSRIRIAWTARSAGYAVARERVTFQARRTHSKASGALGCGHALVGPAVLARSASGNATVGRLIVVRAIQRFLQPQLRRAFVDAHPEHLEIRGRGFLAALAPFAADANAVNASLALGRIAAASTNAELLIAGTTAGTWTGIDEEAFARHLITRCASHVGLAVTCSIDERHRGRGHSSCDGGCERTEGDSELLERLTTRGRDNGERESVKAGSVHVHAPGR